LSTEESSQVSRNRASEQAATGGIKKHAERRAPRQARHAFAELATEIGNPRASGQRERHPQPHASDITRHATTKS